MARLYVYRIFLVANSVLNGNLSCQADKKTIKKQEAGFFSISI